MTDEGDPWVFNAEFQGRVLGAFDLRQFIAWHDSRLTGQQTFQTLVHEDMHAKGIGGSYLHLVLIQDQYNRRIGRSDLSPPYWDFVALHEAQPKAFDLLTGQKTSYYTESAVNERALLAANITRRIETLCNRQGIQDESLQPIILRALFLTLSDHYAGEYPTSARHLLEMLESYYSTAQTVFDGNLDPRETLTNQFRDILSKVLSREFGHKIVHSTSAYFVVNCFLLFIASLHSKQAGVSYWSELLLPILNLLFHGAALPHAVINPETHVLSIFENRFLLRSLMEVNDSSERLVGLTAKSRELHSSRKFESLQSYINDGFFLNHIFDIDYINEDCIYFYFSQLFGGFPATFLAFCDSVFDPQLRRASDEWEHLSKFFTTTNEELWNVAAEHYVELRDQLWRGLGNAVANMPALLATSFINMLVRSWRAGELDFNVLGDELDVFYGTYHFARIKSDSATLEEPNSDKDNAGSG
jgi:hypothetical protein